MEAYRERERRMDVQPNVQNRSLNNKIAVACRGGLSAIQRNCNIDLYFRFPLQIIERAVADGGRRRRLYDILMVNTFVLVQGLYITLSDGLTDWLTTHTTGIGNVGVPHFNLAAQKSNKRTSDLMILLVYQIIFKSILIKFINENVNIYFVHYRWGEKKKE